jgi:RNA polymerase sigma-70 factor (ECF subfamily)
MKYSDVTTEELVRACIQTSDAAAWEEFIRRFSRLIGAVVLRTARRWSDVTPQVLEDLIQDVYFKLCTDNCRLLRTFNSSHKDSIYGYIKVIAANLVHDHFKADRSMKRGGRSEISSPDAIGASSEVVSSCTDGFARTEHEVIVSRIDKCLLSLDNTNSERDRRIFWFYYRVGLSASDIAALPSVGLSTKGVESTLLRLARIVRYKLGTGKA